MNKYSKILTIALGTLAVTGCNDLDTEIKGYYATTEEKKEVVDQDPEKLKYAVTGVMGVMGKIQQVYENHLDIGFPFIMLALDSRGMDMPSDNMGYNWFSFECEMSDGDSNNYTNNMCWRYPYKQIFAVNTLLGTTGTESTDPETQFFIANGLAARAYSYWLLAQCFQFTYAGHENAPCVPIITEKNSEQIALDGGAPRATVAQVYDQIIADLTTAISYLGSCQVAPKDVIESKPKCLVSLATAYGLRARAYLVMQKWAEAKADAEAAIAAFDGSPATILQASAPYFKSIDEPCWMWGIAINETDAGMGGYPNWPSHLGTFNKPSYAVSGAWRRISKTLYATIPATDVRLGWWLNGQKASTNVNSTMIQYIEDNSVPAYCQVKFAPYNDVVGNSLKAQDIPLMRIEEMYLIKAEAQAMAGDATGGALALTEFVSTYRDPGYTCTASTPADVQEAVWMQRRLELWGEGLSWFDIMRLKKGIDRRGGGWPEDWVYNIAPESNIMRLVIPQGEINANKFINPGDNNPVSPQPLPVEDK